jgi:hypothetical protein
MEIVSHVAGRPHHLEIGNTVSHSDARVDRSSGGPLDQDGGQVSMRLHLVHL